MPLLKSTFLPSLLFRNGHFNTIYRPLFMKEGHNYKRKRINTWDNDFIDLDFSEVNSNKIVVLIHGLEGSSESKYILSAAKELNKSGYDTVSFNLRGCSGEDNNLLTTYHSGKTEDLEYVISYLIENYNYEKIMVVGYSLGGNITLKYFGEFALSIHNKVACAVAVSVPIDLASSSKVMGGLKNAKTFKDFDGLYTAPVSGFSSPEDYWEKASSKPYLPSIKKPVLLISSTDDPFLSEECYPFKEARKSNNFYLEVTKYGGHVGFMSEFSQNKNSWLEKRIIKFLSDND